MSAEADRDAVAWRLLDVAPLIVRAMERELRQQSQRADPTHVQILGMLVDRPHSISELAARQHVSLPSMSKTVSTLVERGWIERTPTPEDRRVVLVKLTVSGGDALREARSVMVQAVARAMTPLTAQERLRLADGLAALCKSIEQRAEPAP